MLVASEAERKTGKRGWLWLWLPPTAGCLILFAGLVAAPVFGWQARAGGFGVRAWIGSQDTLPQGRFHGLTLYDQSGAVVHPLARHDWVFTFGSWHWCVWRDFP